LTKQKEFQNFEEQCQHPTQAKSHLQLPKKSKSVLSLDSATKTEQKEWSERRWVRISVVFMADCYSEIMGAGSD
jgi:hypothetical protein